MSTACDPPSVVPPEEGHSSVPLWDHKAYVAAIASLNERLAIERVAREKAEQALMARRHFIPLPDPDWLSNVIREIDGSHRLGAGALAEAIVDALKRTDMEQM